MRSLCAQSPISEFFKWFKLDLLIFPSKLLTIAILNVWFTFSLSTYLGKYLSSKWCYNSYHVLITSVHALKSVKSVYNLKFIFKMYLRVDQYDDTYLKIPFSELVCVYYLFSIFVWLFL